MKATFAPRDGDAAPLRQQREVMAFLLRNRADFVREIERVREVFQTKDSLQTGDAVALDDPPVVDLRFQLGDFFAGFDVLAAWKESSTFTKAPALFTHGVVTNLSGTQRSHEQTIFPHPRHQRAVG